MQQLNKVSTLEVVALCRFVSEAEKRHTMREFAISKLAVFFSRAISAAENKPSVVHVKLFTCFLNSDVVR